MIKSIELRLGNKIFIAGIDYDSGGNAYNDPDGDEEIVVDIDTLKDVIEKPFKYKYIPLTSELLERCGFEKKSNEMQIGGMEMTFYINDSTYFSSCGGLDGSLAVLCLCRGNYFANNLQYVHQLQNLYFALTGEELAIKELA